MYLNTLPYEKPLRQPMVIKKVYQKETNDIKRIYKHHLDERTDIMKNTQLIVKDLNGDII